MKGIVDRFEGDVVVIEIDGHTKDIPRTEVAENVIAGDVVELQNKIWVKNSLETEKRTKKLKELMDNVWEE